MKAVFKICNMRTVNDVNSIRQAVASNEGVVACHINKEKGEVSVVFDNYCLSKEELIGSIEDLGYTVI